MGSMSKTLGALALASGALFAGDGLAGTLDQMRDSKTMRIAYDPDAPPFSYIVPGSPPNADPQGYSVELCRAVFDKLKEQLKIPDLKIVYVAVNSRDRFDAITANKADLLCESATATLSRRQTVEFSIPIFIDGASFVIRPDGPRDVKLLAGKKVAVLPGTTTEQELRRALTGTKIDADIVLVKTNQEGIELVESGGVALALRRGDPDFRLAVDTALSHIYRRGEITTIFKSAFGVLTTPSPLLAALYQMAGLPD
jgi:ABC-type amino acid transport substrate-binding protein